MALYGILLFFILEYVQPGNYAPILLALHVNSIVPLGTLLLSMISNGPVRASDVLTSPNARWLMYLLGLMILSGLTCDVKHYALNVFQMVLGYCLAYFFMRKELYTIDRLKKVIVTLVLVHIVVGVLNPELLANDGQRHYVRAGYFLGDGNDFALSINIAIPLCLFLMLTAKSKMMRLVSIGFLFLLVFAVVATLSRGGILALFSLGFYYWLKSDRKILGAIGLVIVVCFVFTIASPQFFDRMATLTKTGEERDGSAQGRIFAWKAAINMALDHPLLGVGVGHFPVKYGAQYQPKEFGLNAIPWQTAHSSYFLLLGELGFPGLIFIVGLIISNIVAGEQLLQQIRRKGSKDFLVERHLVTALNASLIGFAVGGAFLSAAYYPHLYLLAALLECGREFGRKALVSTASAAEEKIAVPRPIYQQASI
ncbi:MAG: O-antigen ligase family protein [Nitrospira sp.]|nr:O-antigen ligase family protein [Nitrospira sp.]